jgi:hypothetical protein
VSERPTQKARKDDWIEYADELEQALVDANAEIARLEGEVRDLGSGELVRQLRRRVSQLTRGRG